MAFGIFLSEFGMGHKAKGSCTVLDGDGDDTTTGQTLPECTTVVLCAETASMDIDHDGQGISDRGGRGDNTEVETIFAHHVV